MTIKKDSITSISYEIIGNENSSDTLLFIHGAGGNMEALKALAMQLPEYKCVLIDLPGHNLSGGDVPKDVSGYTSAVESFIKSNSECFGNNITCIGHSMGGCISLELALKKVPEIKRLVILNSGAKINIDKKFMKKVEEEGKISKLYLFKAGGSYFHPRTYSFFLKGFKKMITSQKVMVKDFKIADGFDKRDSVNNIKLPVLIATGEKEILAMPEHSEFLHSQIKGSQLFIMEGVAHLMPIIVPEKLAEKMRPFLNSTVNVLN